MLPSLLRKFHAFSRRLVVRVVLIALLAFLALGLAKLGARLIPREIEPFIGGDAVDNILSVIANSMLTVTTFSLTVMAAAHRMVSTSWTPRAHQMLLQDTTTHTVLATFVGAYLYALSAIILRDLEIFAGPGLIVLFGMTLLVVLLIVVAIIRWISHLEMLGSLINTAQRIQDSTRAALALRADAPCLGAHPLDPEAVPEGAGVLRAADSGYVQTIYQDRLQQAAEGCDGRIWLLHPVGAHVHRGDALARYEGEEKAMEEAIAANVVLGSLRNFDQDPGFGLTCLSEIAVRALSPGVNDPGTALDMLHRIARVLMAVEGPFTAPQEAQHDRLWLPALATEAMTHETLAPILSDGADRQELARPIDQTLRALARHEDPGIAQAARALQSACKS
ncbi:DUF2254 domain-containing protein [Pseudooceanicola sp. 200-1SW]|uniref:DUF2254 domain-containing protein n=1 Tax=Pseudooceanicola sp. 200-1SW TaxID=3425949 RepID=UPI003D7FFB78